jgi:hypothetical protein
MLVLVALAVVNAPLRAELTLASAARRGLATPPSETKVS